ncbi:MAG: choice-of-anchor J domain-containing protein, partial [Dyadobacter sp.]
QGVVIGTATIPYTSDVDRSYYPAYSEGVTLIHEIGHYFYLYHTFGDDIICNNDDFRIEPGWNLPNGAGPEGDDTPEEKGFSDNSYFGNPSQNYSDGCTVLPFGMMYGSFMNYFDDRALFMFSDGSRKRIEGCIELYRPGLKTSNGATPPVGVTDAFLLSATPRGIPERRANILNNAPVTIVLRNNGTTVLNSITINRKMDNNAATGNVFLLNLQAGKDTILQLDPIVESAGSHIFTLYTSLPNAATDRFPENDTIESFISINGNVVNAPFNEYFTSASFPPAGWSIWNPQQNTTWIESVTSGYTAAGAATVQNFSYKNGGELDELNTPAIEFNGADSAVLLFKIAYGVYDLVDVSVWDGLEVYVSNNGGISYDLAFKKTGKDLRTVSAAQTSAFVALPSTLEKWRQEKVNLTPYLVSGKKILIKFRNVTAYGNNLYLDDVEVSSFSSFARDAFPKSIVNIPDFYCGGNPVPSVVIGTNGNTPLTSLKINYSIDNGANTVVNWTGSLTVGNTATIPLQAISNLNPGKHIFTVYTSNPNGLDDNYLNNDTIRKTFYIVGKTTSPYTEGFETAVFPPNGSALQNPDGLITWEKANVGATGSGSAVIKNFQQENGSTIDKFISPVVTGNQAYDSVFVAFDYAYSPGLNSPLSTTEALDTLEIQVTQDCGLTFTTVWKKWGLELQTVLNPNQTLEFIPQINDWKNIKIPVFPVVGNGDFQAFFVAKSNKQNNLFVDNINIYGITVPPRLKKQGYLIYPNPFTSQFLIRNYEEPTDFQSAAVYNSIGQKVWQKDFNGNAQKIEPVNLGKLPTGIYLLKLNYTGKTVVERILKQ